MHFYQRIGLFTYLFNIYNYLFGCYLENGEKTGII